MTPNPMLDTSGLLRFPDFIPDHVSPGLDVLLLRAERTVARAETAAPSWNACVAELDDALEHLNRGWGLVRHLQSVLTTPALRAAHDQNIARVTAFYAGLEQNQKLFEQYIAIAQSTEFTSYSDTRRRVINTALRDFRLGGAELNAHDKLRFSTMKQELAELSTRFANNVVDATDAFEHIVDNESDLTGLPADVIAQAHENAQEDGKLGWKLTLQAPCYLPVMMYAESRDLRKVMMLASTSRASDLGAAERDNSAVMDRIVMFRGEMAGLLGFENFGQYSLASKMANAPAEVLTFLNQLANRALPNAKRDRAELETFAADALGLLTLEPWDLTYVSQKLMQARYSFSQQEVKPYFPLDQVLSGLFSLITALYGLTVGPDDAPVWHPDVRFFKLTDASGTLVGQFYLDPFAREGKRGGAWMNGVRSRRAVTDSIQTPVVYLVCNFGRGAGSRPATLTHNDIITLFHEMGHGLHHLLSEVDEVRLSGVNGVEWDAVELPSQFMENFCWEWERLRDMSGHIDSGELLPRALFDKMLAARHFQSGMQMMRQIELSMFDMELHTSFAAGGDILGLLKQIRAKVAVNPALESDRFPHYFSHIFSGGYAAGYYSYKWAEVLSADAYSAFEGAPHLIGETGDRFRREVLAPGGSRRAIENFRAFLGRDPDISALLRHSGLAA